MSTVAAVTLWVMPMMVRADYSRCLRSRSSRQAVGNHIDRYRVRAEFELRQHQRKWKGEPERAEETDDP